MTLEKLNELRARNGKTQLSSWKSGRAKLAEAIAKEEALLTAEAELPAEAASDLSDAEVGQSENQIQADGAHPHDTMTAKEASDANREDGVDLGVKIPRGAINAMCVELLQTDTPYEAIVEAIRARYPTARTTARSLASVAMDLRADGLEVPTRRRPAAAKDKRAEGEA